LTPTKGCCTGVLPERNFEGESNALFVAKMMFWCFLCRLLFPSSKSGFGDILLLENDDDAVVVAVVVVVVVERARSIIASRFVALSLFFFFFFFFQLQPPNPKP
jgi:hypothetical protein